jgi:biotin carboxylase
MVSSRPTVLILGAGTYQVPLIKVAQSMGLQVIAVSPPGNYRGIRIANRWIEADTRDVSSVAALLQDVPLDGVLTVGTDVALRTWAHIAQQRGLVGPSVETALLCSSKIRMKEAFNAFGVPTPEHQVVSTRHEIREFLERRPDGVVLKAPDSSGSRGITHIRSPKDIEEALIFARENTHQDRFLVEEYFTGAEFGAQVFVEQGQVCGYVVHGDGVSSGRTTAPISHWLPFQHPQISEFDLTTIFESLQKCTELENGVLNVDLISDGDRICVLEVGARLGATGIPELIQYGTGLDIYRALVRQALGYQEFPAITLTRPVAIELIRARERGIVVNLPDVSDVVRISDVLEVQIDLEVGEPVREFLTGNHRIGAVFSTGLDATYAVHLAKTIADEISTRIQSVTR